MGAVGVLLISVLTVCLAKGCCLAGGGTNERQNSGPHRTLRDVENSIEKALRLFHSVKSEGQRAVQLAAREVVYNPAASPSTGTAMTSEENGPLTNPTAPLSPEAPAGVYEAAATALSPEAPTGVYEAAATALSPEAPTGVYEAAATALSPEAPTGVYEAAATALSPEAPTGIYEATALSPEVLAGVNEAATTTLSPEALAGSYEVTTC